MVTLINSAIHQVLSNKHTSGAAIVYAAAKYGCPLLSSWAPHYKPQLDQTADILESAAVFYGFAAAGDSAKSATKEDLSGLAQTVNANVETLKSGDTQMLKKSDIPTPGAIVKLLLLLAIPAMLLASACTTQLAPGGAYSTINTNNPGGSPGTALGEFVFLADKTMVDSKDTMVAFLTWEQQNRPQLPASVTKAADSIRIYAPLWFTNAWLLRSNYLWIRDNVPAQAATASNQLSAATSQLSSQASSIKAIAPSIK